jgi:hypothetical protein
MGGSKDLTYLGDLLLNQGGHVLKSKVNEYYNSVKGIKAGGRSLADEILEQVSQNSQVSLEERC